MGLTLIDAHSLGLGELLERPLVDDYAVFPQNAYVSALHQPEVRELVTGRDTDGYPQLAPRYAGEEVGWIFHLPYEKNPIPANKASGRSHWAHTARAVAGVRETAFLLARANLTPQPRIKVRLDWEVTTRRTRDEDNLVPCMKALVDGIRSAGIIPDDDRRYCTRLMPEIHFAPPDPKRPLAHMLLWVLPQTD
jgi:hypothetical protein